MSSTSPPPEAQRFGRSQTPESPRPVHIPEPANIPVLLNQMDPVFNDTATYNIPNGQSFSPIADPTSEQGFVQGTGVDEHDAVQNFFREAEHQATAEPEPSVNANQNAPDANPQDPTEISLFPSVASSEHAGGHLGQLSSAASLYMPMNSNMHEKDDTKKIGSGVGEPEMPDKSATHVSETESIPSHPQQPEEFGNKSASEPESGVDYQSLLDTIAQSASTAPNAESLTAPTTAASTNDGISRSLPSVPGLPPKPPPQENPVDFPSYSSYENGSAPNAMLGVTTNESNDGRKMIGNETLPAALPNQADLQSAVAQLYPSLPVFTPYGQMTAGKTDVFTNVNQGAPGQDVNRSQDPLERPWSPRTQTLYDRFLEDERRYVTEGIWDKFPLGSRLFVGNLPSEKVTKRDLFHKFHKHGQLAQISIKQAYGFVQFLESSSCLAALNAEQGVEIRGRKVHLEVSKPQKNTRNAGASGGGNKGQQRRRSRSPDRGARRDNNRNYSDFRDEPGRRRDDFRNRRSPSPRPYRQRDDYRSGGRDGRSRSPFHGNSFGSPSLSSLDDEASLQLPRRDPRLVPDVQILVLEPEVVQSFINWVEQGFRNKGLQASTIWVSNRLPLPAVIKRQIIEGVQAVVKLTRVAQNNSKIPLQVFDRSAGASNVKFNEYVDLDVSVAADVVLQARQKERDGHTGQNFRPPIFPPQNYQPPVQYGAPQPPIPYPQQSPPPPYMQQQHGQGPQYPYPGPQQGPYRPSTQPPTPTTQPPNLQQLLANLRQPPTPSAAQNLQAAAQNGQLANFQGFLGNMGNSHQYPQATQPSYGQFSANSQQPGVPQPNVQNIMEQLARYQR